MSNPSPQKKSIDNEYLSSQRQIVLGLWVSSWWSLGFDSGETVGGDILLDKSFLSTNNFHEEGHCIWNNNELNCFESQNCNINTSLWKRKENRSGKLRKEKVKAKILFFYFNTSKSSIWRTFWIFLLLKNFRKEWWLNISNELNSLWKGFFNFIEGLKSFSRNLFFFVGK